MQVKLIIERAYMADSNIDSTAEDIINPKKKDIGTGSETLNDMLK